MGVGWSGERDLRMHVFKVQDERRLNDSSTRRSGDDFPHDPTVHIGEAEISSGVTVGEVFMIKAEQMEDP
jgi:hypothetical protein